MMFFNGASIKKSKNNIKKLREANLSESQTPRSKKGRVRLVKRLDVRLSFLGRALSSEAENFTR